MLFAGIYLLLSLPILLSQYYNPTTDFTWILLALSGMLALLLASFTLIAKLKYSIIRKVIGFTLISSIASFQLTRLMSFYFQGESLNERFFYHFTLNSLTEAGSAFLELQLAIAVYLLVLLILTLKALNKPWPIYLKNKFQIVLVMILFLSLEPDVYRLANWQANATLDAREETTFKNIDWQNMGLQKEALTPFTSAVVPGKNLLFIYLESLEQIYLDKSLFPGLLPNLQAFQQQGLTFPNMKQTPGTSWTIAGIVSSQCGTPLLFNQGPQGNDALQNGFLNQAVCLGDILARGGYQQVYMGGASKRFAGKGAFLTEHGYHEVSGKSALIPRLEDTKYVHGWGLYDDSLFELAEKKITELAAKDHPFNLTMLTLDTHHPKGHASRSCSPYQAKDNSILDAVHCSDYLLGKFLNKLRQQPAWDNTIVVLFSDHLAMRNVAQKYYPKNYERKLLFTILNGNRKGIIEHSGTHLDIAPTVLSMLEVEHDRQFLGGQNLLAEPFIPLKGDPFAKDWKETLRYLNHNFLTKRSNSICQSRTLVKVSNNQLTIGKQNINLSISGHSVKIKTLQSKNALIAWLNADGSIKSTKTVNFDKLHNVLYQFSTDPFLLIAKADRLPRALKNFAEHTDEISVLLGNSHGEIIRLGGASSITKLHIKNNDCIDLLKQIAQSSHIKPLDTLLKECNSEVTGVENYMNSENNSIQLSYVTAYGEAYKAELIKIDEFNYKVSSYTLRDDNQKNLSKSNLCHASFKNHELIIPRLSYEGQARAIRMKQITKDGLRFRIVENIGL